MFVRRSALNWPIVPAPFRPLERRLRQADHRNGARHTGREIHVYRAVRLLKARWVGGRDLRLPRLKAGDSDQLLLRSFRLRSANASQFGAVSSGPSTGRVRPKPAPVAPTL